MGEGSQQSFVGLCQRFVIVADGRRSERVLVGILVFLLRAGRFGSSSCSDLVIWGARQACFVDFFLMGVLLV
jgi:hypothetical protein